MTSPLIRIVNSTFHRPANPRPFFQNLAFTLPPVTASSPQRWSVIGPSTSGKSTFLQILQGQHTCHPPSSRTYPHLTAQHKYPTSSISLVEFSSSGGLGERVRGEYMSSRYESRREGTDITLRDWLLGTAENLPLWTDNYDFKHHEITKRSREQLEGVSRGLRLERILDQAVSTLSNGQGRRARIAQALLGGAELVLLDEPFMGLDPPSTDLLSKLLLDISTPSKNGESSLMSQVLISMRPQDKLPEWVTHLIYLDNQQVLSMGERSKVQDDLLKHHGIKLGHDHASGGLLEKAYSSFSKPQTQTTTTTEKPKEKKEALVEMHDVKITYWGKQILSDFSWTIRRSERWGLFGPNGSGKTTVLSLLTSDHPLSYSLPIKIFGRSRLPEVGKPGISIFDIQSRIGHSSPEIHQFFPKYRTLRQCVESAYADTFLSKPALDADANAAVDVIFERFGIRREEQESIFGGVSLSTQRLALFMRAVVKKPDLVVLDEAFSGMDEGLRDKCLKYLEDGGGLDDRQALVVVSHIEEEVPSVVDKYIVLREAGTSGPPVFGKR